jgi:hypothetical protein
MNSNLFKPFHFEPEADSIEAKSADEVDLSLSLSGENSQIDDIKSGN